MNLPATPGVLGGLAVLMTALEGKAPLTQAAYLADLRAFAAWAGFATPGDAVGAFLELEHGQGHAAATTWRGELEAQGLAPRSVARKLSSLRAVVRSAKRQGVVEWSLDVDGPKIRGFVQSTRGPSPEDVDAVITALEDAGREAGGQFALRDLAILLLLHDSGLRGSEVCSLELRHLDLAAGLVRVAEKGGGGARIEWPISNRAKRALGRWLKARGKRAGPVFCGVGVGRGTRGIGRKTVWRRVVQWAERCGFEGWTAHGLRHAAITKLHHETGDLERARRFARHRDPATTSAHYIDAEPDQVRADVAVVSRKGRRRK